MIEEFYFRVKERISVFVLMLLLVGIYSCSSDDEIATADHTGMGVGAIATESGDNYEITYQFKDGVIVLDKNLMKYLTKVESDSILFFSNQMPDSIKPKIGQIYSARVTEKTPYGLGNEVISLSDTEDGNIRCVTKVTPLEDIFETLELKTNISLSDILDNKRGFYDENGDFHEASMANYDELQWGNESSSAKTRVKAGSPEVLIVPTTMKDDETGLFAEGSVALGGILTIEKDNETGSFENSIELFAGIKGDIGIERNAGNKEKGLLNVPLLTIPIYNGLIIAGPIILRPFVSVEINLKGEANGKATFGIGYQGSLKYGWNEKGKIVENNFKKTPLENLLTRFELNGEARIGPEFAFKAGTGLYTKNLAVVLQPTVSASVGASITFSTEVRQNKPKVEADADATFDVEAELEGAIEANIMGKRHKIGTSDLQKISLNIWNTTIPIFPKLDNESFDINVREGFTPLMFDAQYSVTGGLVAKLWGGKLGLRIEKNGEEIYTKQSGSQILFSVPTTVAFELDELGENVSYSAVPCILFKNAIYEWNGKDFSSRKQGTNDLTGTWKCTKYNTDGSVLAESTVVMNADGSATDTTTSGTSWNNGHPGGWSISDDGTVNVNFSWASGTYNVSYYAEYYEGKVDSTNPSAIKGKLTRMHQGTNSSWTGEYEFIMTR